jgi:YesN/AraC family two-component response regulator
VHEEINRVRIDRIQQLLRESDRSIFQIALDMEYAGTDNFWRYFKKATGMTPLQYRRKYGKR